ncbi:MAG: nucleoside triphosphate pyrophosphohydrolase [Candidatus Nanoperiomorbaceae bacterium]
MDPLVIHTVWHQLGLTEYRRELVRKISEEANEIPLSGDHRDEMVEELADLQTVVDALRNSLGFERAGIQDAMRHKAAQKGGFGQRYFIDHVDLDDNSKWVAKFREQPHKYVETDGGFSVG